MKTKFLWGILFLLLVGFTACEDPFSDDIVDDDVPGYFVTMQQDAFSGRRYVIFDVADVSSLFFDVVNTTKLSVVERGKDNYFNITLDSVADENGSVNWGVTLNLNDGKSVPLTTLVYLDVTIDDKKLEKVVILRNTDLMYDSPLSYNDTQKEIINTSSMTSKIGSTTNLALDLPHEGAHAHALDAGLLAHEKQFVITPMTTQKLHISTGEHYEETFDAMNVSVGLGGFGLLGGKAAGWTLGSNVSYSQNTSHESKKYHLYDARDYIGTTFVSQLKAELNDISSAPEDSASYLEDLDKLMLYIDKDFLALIQKQNIINIQQAKDFLNNHGTHIITAGVFGAKASYRYDKHADSYFESIEQSAGVELYANHAGDLGTNASDKLKALDMLGFNKQDEIKAKAEGGDAYSKLITNSECTSDFTTFGGPTDLNLLTFTSNITIKNSVMISYNNTMDTTTQGVTKGLPNYGLIPIWCFFHEESERKLLMDAFEQYRIPNPTRGQLVLADVYYEYFENYSDKERDYDKFVYPIEKEFEVTSGVRKKLTYYPMVPNKLYNGSAYEGRTDAIFDILTKGAAGCSYSGVGVFYYAFGRSDEVDGITDLCFWKDEHKAGYTEKGYIARGDASHEGFHIVGRYPVRVTVHYGDLSARKGGTKQTLVTGMAVCGKNGGEVYGSTAGTIYQRNNNFKDGKNIFQYYYDNGFPNGNPDNRQRWFHYTAGLLGVWDFFHKTTTTTLIDAHGNEIDVFDANNLPPFGWFKKGDRWK